MTPNAAKYQAHFDHKVATDHSVQAAVAQILKFAGCGNCGRLSYLTLGFIGDPGPELVKQGITELGQVIG